MIDMHSHVLPKMDDGASSIQESYHMLQEAEQAGFTAIIATSHYLEEHYESDFITRHAWIQAMNKMLQQEKREIQLYIGSEIYVTPNLVKLIEEKKATTLADSQYLLFELPMNTNVTYLEQLIFEIQSAGLVPIIAHPERYSYVQRNPNWLLPFIEKGVLFQGNYGSIQGIYGKSAKTTLELLLQHHMIHFLGTDAHKKDTIYTQMEEIMIQLEKQIGKEQLENLTTINPEKVIKKEEIVIPKPEQIKKGFHFCNIFKRRGERI